MKSNCYLVAWEKYLNNEATWLCFRKSKYSRLTGKIPRPIKLLALVLMYPVVIAYAILHTLAFETWPHFIWSNTSPIDAEEFVPLKTNSPKWFPPVIFDGQIQKLKE